MERDFRMLIDGELVEGATSFDVINPATGSAFAQCPKADRALVDRAVAAAKRAFPAGRRLPSNSARPWSTSSPMRSRRAPANSPAC